MSYDLSLYTKAFLDRALATNLGDWRNADPIPEAAVMAFIEAAIAAGFRAPDGGAFSVDRVRTDGIPFGSEFELNTDECLAQMSVHRGELAFTIPYSDRADASIQLCNKIGKSVATEHGLAFWDPQDDEGE